MSHNEYDNRHYVIISTDDLNTINFSETISSFENLRYNLNQDKFIVKYDGEMPPSIFLCSTRSQEYSRNEILQVLKTAEWKLQVKASEL